MSAPRSAERHVVQQQPRSAPRAAARSRESASLPRHSVVVRVTHWLVAASFLGLAVSGGAILVAHPRLYWGETGALGGPALLDLPLPFLYGHSGWGRYLHFLSAWLCVLAGAVYLVYGIFSRHFGRHLLPRLADLRWAAISAAVATRLGLRRSAPARRYNAVQRLSYALVVFLLFPLMVWTGLAMSPAVTSAFPELVEWLGGQQSARTLHFFVANVLILFLVVHVAMTVIAGFIPRMRAMLVGGPDFRQEAS